MNLLDYGLSKEQAQNFDNQGNLKPLAPMQSAPTKKEQLDSILQPAEVKPIAKQADGWYLPERDKTASTSDFNPDDVAHAVRNANAVNQPQGTDMVKVLLSNEAKQRYAKQSATNAAYITQQLEAAGIKSGYDPLVGKYYVNLKDGVTQWYDKDDFEGSLWSQLKDQSAEIALATAGAIGGAALAAGTGGLGVGIAAALLGGTGAGVGNIFDTTRNISDSQLSYTNSAGEKLSVQLAKDMSWGQKLNRAMKVALLDSALSGVGDVAMLGGKAAFKAGLKTPVVGSVLRSPVHAANWATKATNLKSLGVGGVTGVAGSFVDPILGPVAGIAAGWLYRASKRKAVQEGLETADSGLFDNLLAKMGQLNPVDLAARTRVANDLDILLQNLGKEIDAPLLADNIRVLSNMIDMDKAALGSKAFYMNAAYLAAAKLNVLAVLANVDATAAANLKKSVKDITEVVPKAAMAQSVDVNGVISMLSEITSLGRKAIDDTTELALGLIGDLEKARVPITKSKEALDFMQSFYNFSEQINAQFQSAGTKGLGKGEAYTALHTSNNEFLKDLAAYRSAFNDARKTASRVNSKAINDFLGMAQVKNYTLADLVGAYVETANWRVSDAEKKAVANLKDSFRTFLQTIGRANERKLGDLENFAIANGLEYASEGGVRNFELINKYISALVDDIDGIANQLYIRWGEPKVLEKVAKLVKMDAKEARAAIADAITVNADNVSAVNTFVSIARQAGIDISSLETIAVQNVIAKATKEGFTDPKLVANGLKALHLTTPFATSLRKLAMDIHNALPKAAEVVNADIRGSTRQPLNKGIGASSWANKAQMWWQNFQISKLNTLIGGSPTARQERVMRALAPVLVDPTNVNVRTALEKELDSLYQELSKKPTKPISFTTKAADNIKPMETVAPQSDIQNNTSSAPKAETTARDTILASYEKKEITAEQAKKTIEEIKESVELGAKVANGVEEVVPPAPTGIGVSNVTAAETKNVTKVVSAHLLSIPENQLNEAINMAAAINLATMYGKREYQDVVKIVNDSLAAIGHQPLEADTILAMVEKASKDEAVVKQALLIQQQNDNYTAISKALNKTANSNNVLFTAEELAGNAGVANALAERAIAGANQFLKLNSEAELPSYFAQAAQEAAENLTDTARNGGSIAKSANPEGLYNVMVDMWNKYKGTNLDTSYDSAALELSIKRDRELLMEQGADASPVNKNPDLLMYGDGNEISELGGKYGTYTTQQSAEQLAGSGHVDTNALDKQTTEFLAKHGYYDDKGKGQRIARESQRLNKWVRDLANSPTVQAAAEELNNIRAADNLPPLALDDIAKMIEALKGGCK